MPRPASAPPLSFFDEPRPAAGARRLTLRIGPLCIELGDLDDSLHRVLLERYTPFANDGGAQEDDAPLRIRVAPNRLVPRIRNSVWLAGRTMKDWIKSGMTLTETRG